MKTGRTEGFVFGPDADTPFNPKASIRRADAASKAAGPDRITLHRALDARLRAEAADLTAQREQAEGAARKATVAVSR